MESITTILACELPELFVPYYFECNFNVLEMIASEFEIVLPPIPMKQDYKGRFFYYGKICEALLEFRIKNEMSPYELWAFLYDFAPKYIGGFESYIVNEQELPKPKGAYFIGAHKDDAFMPKDENEIVPWQCNPDTLAGDMLIMYLRSPISAIDSVWRSVSIGFNDPFFHHYRCAYIGNPSKIRRISQKKMENDKVLNKLYIVRKNMQGVNGVEIYPSIYNYLLELGKSDLPKFEFAVDNKRENLKREKDVEDEIVKPFLAKLGYTEDDYVQQLRIHVGNHNFTLIPDFVVQPIISTGHHFAKYQIEVKYSITSSKQFEEVKNQARSYAKQLGAPYSVIISKEGIWVSSKNDDYSEDLAVLSWSELNNNEDEFYKLAKILGK